MCNLFLNNYLTKYGTLYRIECLSADSTRELRRTGLQMWLHVVTMASFNTNKGDIVVWIFSHSNYTTILPEICRSEPDNCYGFV